MINKASGFIGLLALLISVGIIALIIVRTDLFSPKTLDENGNKVESKNILETGFDAIDKAKDVKNLVEQNSRKTIEQ